MYNEIKSDLDALVAKFNSVRQDGKITLPEVGELLHDAQDTVVHLVKAFDVPGTEKKALAIQFIGEIYDRCIAPFNLPGPDAILDPVLKKLLLGLADGAIEAVVRKLQSEPTGAAA